MTKFYASLVFAILSTIAIAQELSDTRLLLDKPVEGLDDVDSLVSTQRIRVWKVNEDNAEQNFVEMDTISKNFYTFNPIYKKSIANNYLGNLGSPYESMIYFDRPRDLDFGMADVYRAYLFLPQDFVFFNTKIPYTNLQYTSGGSKKNREESLGVTFSRNVNKDWNVTGYGNLIYARGLYAYQSVKNLNFTFLTSYVKPRYQLYFIANETGLRNYENGGILSDDYITNPELYPRVTNAEGISTKILSNTVNSSLYNTNVYLKHKYSLGFERAITKKDTVLYEFVPVSSIVHTFNYSNYIKMYTEESGSSLDIYPDPKVVSERAYDRLSTKIISNEFGLYLNEGVNKYAIFGIGGYIKNDIISVDNNPWRSLMASMDTLSYREAVSYYKGKTPGLSLDSARYVFAKGYHPTHYSNTKIGGTIYKRLGNSLFYNLKAELYMQGYRAGDYLFAGDVKLRFNKLDSVFFIGSAELGGRTPYYYLNTYYSNYYWWDKKLKEVHNQRFTGQLSFPTFKLSAKFSLENSFEYVYFDTLGTPMQEANVQVTSFDLKKDFTLGHFHWENIITYQASSSKAIAVPDLAVYTNLYLTHKINNVLDVQLGVDVRYFTAYYAPQYIPAIGRFVQQTEKKIGNYPLSTVYVNFHLKRMRFFIEYYHVNKGLLVKNYFASPSYPYNPRMMKVGLSWNFYD